jgi:hypothetical protein
VVVLARRQERWDTEKSMLASRSRRMCRYQDPALNTHEVGSMSPRPFGRYLPCYGTASQNESRKLKPTLSRAYRCPQNPALRERSGNTLMSLCRLIHQSTDHNMWGLRPCFKPHFPFSDCSPSTTPGILRGHITEVSGTGCG